MTNPEQMRNDAERLRELAGTMDRQAEEMNSLLSNVKSALERDIWSGPAPEELEERIQGWINGTESGAESLEENAKLCRNHADQLDDDADDDEDEDEDEDDEGN